MLKCIDLESLFDHPTELSIRDTAMLYLVVRESRSKRTAMSSKCSTKIRVLLLAVVVLHRDTTWEPSEELGP